MSYDEAYSLNEGDQVIVRNTGEQRTVDSVSGTLFSIFVLLDNGEEYRHDKLIKREDDESNDRTELHTKDE